MIEFKSLLLKEILRFLKVFFQTIIAPIFISTLYFLIFGLQISNNMYSLKSQNLFIGYKEFVIPGIIIMSILQNSYSNSSSSIIQSKITGSIIFLLISPIEYWKIFFAYVLASIFRGFIIGIGIFLSIYVVYPIKIYSIIYILLFAFFGSLSLASIGLISGIVAEKFDQLSAFQNFLITPLTFLSGVFYSINKLPKTYYLISKFNPIFYIIDGFRFGFFSISDVCPIKSLIISITFSLLLSVFSILILRSGYNFRK